MSFNRAQKRADLLVLQRTDRLSFTAWTDTGIGGVAADQTNVDCLLERAVKYTVNVDCGFWGQPLAAFRLAAHQIVKKRLHHDGVQFGQTDIAESGL